MASRSIVFLGSKPIGYACFQYLLEQCTVLDIAVSGLLTQERKEFGEGHDLTALAQQHGIKVFASLEELPECDVLYSVQYHKILKAEHIARARQLAVNLHMAPLPEYRGSNQFSFAIMDGKKEFGTTIHRMDNRIDHGDILFQKRFPIPENCWVDQLYRLTYEASVRLFCQTLKHVLSGNFVPVPQADLLPRYGTSLHMKNEMETLKQINLSEFPEMIERRIRATSMPGFEPPYCMIGGEKVYFKRGE